jgi:iron uptake system component EfeO
MHRVTSIALIGACAVGLSACSSSGADTGAAGGPVRVAASDTACQLSRMALTAGTTTFAITNKGAKTTEVYVYATGDRIVAEKENIGPGLGYQLTVQLAAGSYVVACKPGQSGAGIRVPVTVTGASAAPAADPLADAAVARYRAYVQGQADALVPLVRRFTDAVKAGDVAQAKALYAPSRVPWESIEPVAESFGDLDPKIDRREADLEAGQAWTGWHRLEKALWVEGSTAGLGPVTDQLGADIAELRSRVGTAEITTTSIGNGAKELLDEVATRKITGEEEAFSHTDLVDFAANIAGARQAYEALRPLVQRSQGDLVPTLDQAFAVVDAALAPYARGTGYVAYDTIDGAARRELARVVDALSEPLSQLSAAATQ